MIAIGNNGKPIVQDDVDRLVLLRQICRVERELGWECLAYCLMDTHIHLVVLTPEPNLGRGMQWLVGGYAFSFNRRHERRGHLFAGPYYAKLMGGEATSSTRACTSC